MLDQLKEAFRTTTYFTNGLSVEQAFETEGAINVICQLIQGANGPFHCINVLSDGRIRSFDLVYIIEDLEILSGSFYLDMSIISIEQISNYLEIKEKNIKLEIKKAALTL